MVSGGQDPWTAEVEAAEAQAECDRAARKLEAALALLREEAAAVGGAAATET